VNVTWLDFLVVGMTSIGVDWGGTIFMRIAFLDFIWRCCGMDAIEVAQAVRSRNSVVVEMSVMGKGPEVTRVIGLRCSEVGNVCLSLGLYLAIIESTIELFVLRWIRVLVAGERCITSRIEGCITR
jgi:hypothetical protein